MSETVTALDLVTRAYSTLGVAGLEQTLSPALASEGLKRLNSLVSSWAIQPLTIPFSSRTVFPTVTGRGTEANPYTIGPTGNVVMATVPHELSAVSLLLTTPTPTVEVPLTVLDEPMWANLRVKDLTSTQPTYAYYQPSVPNGELIFWPLPDNTVNSLVIYRDEQLIQFADLSTSYILPDGFVDALEPNLAVRLAPAAGVAVSPDLAHWAITSLATLKRANTVMSDLENEFAYGFGGYNIYTGNG